ncbi:MAG: adenosylcobinamide-GDP ribazoletransferase [Pseudomonadota bacterium]
MTQSENQSQHTESAGPGGPEGLMHPADSLYAAALLTMLPVPVDHAAAGARGARAAWAYPMVGALVGLIAGAAYALALAFGIAPGPAGWLAVGVGVAVTGALHEDGLADAADGLGLPRSRERALEIMRDSRTGAFGAVALITVLAMRASAIGSLGAVEGIIALAAAGALSRAALVVVWRALPPARSDGMAARAGTPPQQTALAALAIGVLFAAPAAGLGGGALIGALVATAVAALAVARLASRRIGGQTGDVLGATQQAAEAAALAALTI